MPYEYSYNKNLVKPVRFIGAARVDLTGFPEPARRRAGHELYMVQVGRKPEDYKPVPSASGQAHTKSAFEMNPARSA